MSAFPASLIEARLSQVGLASQNPPPPGHRRSDHGSRSLLLTECADETAAKPAAAHAPEDAPPLPADAKVYFERENERVTCSVNVSVSQNSRSGRVRVLVDTDLPGLQSLHWGVVPWGPFGDSHWEAPAEELRPLGSRLHDKTAVQTPLLLAGGGGGGRPGPARLLLDFDAASAPRALNFVLHDSAKNTWTHTAQGRVFHVALPPRSQALLAAAQAAAQQRSGIQALLSTLNSFIADAEAAEGGPGGDGRDSQPEAGWEPTLAITEGVAAVVDVMQRVGVRVTSHSAGAGVRLRVESDIPEPLTLHWGVVPRGARDDIWALPDPEIWPRGSSLHKKQSQDRAVQSPMCFVAAQPQPGGGLSKPFSYLEFEIGTDPAVVRFVLKEAQGNAWFDDDGSDWQVALPQLQLDAQPSDGLPPALGPNSLLRRPESSGGEGPAGALSVDELRRLDDVRAALADAEKAAAVASAAKAAALQAAQAAAGEGAPAVAGVRARRLAAEANAAARAAADASSRASAALAGAGEGGAGAPGLPGGDSESLAAQAWAGFAGRQASSWHEDAARAAVRAESERLDWLRREAESEQASRATAAQQANAQETKLLRSAADAKAAAAAASVMPLPPAPARAAEAGPDIPPPLVFDPRLAPPTPAAMRGPADPAPSPRLPVSAPEVSSGTGSGREVLLQGFNWESARKGGWYRTLTAKAGELHECGITVVWMPPPTDSVSAEGYMPRDLYDLNSKYGSVAELREAVAALHDQGLKVLGDAVLNHRCAHAQSASGVWNRFGGKLAWDARAIVSDDPHFQGQGAPSQGDHFHAAPNIDHTQSFVRRDICEWLAWMRDHVGYDGWRLDFVRGFSGVAVKEYLEHTSPSFAVGEYWDTLAYHHSEPEHCQDAHRQRIVNWINAAGGLAGAFDVTTKGILHAALERREYWRLSDASGKPPGVMGWWPSRAVTFVENHDTGSTQGHWRFPGGKELQGYAYILTHPGTPTIFWDHLFEATHLAGPIKRLAALRKRAGVHCRSEVKILVAEREVYAAQVDDRVICKLGPGHWEPPDAGRWQRSEAGSEWATWERRA